MKIGSQLSELLHSSPLILLKVYFYGLVQAKFFIVKVIAFTFLQLSPTPNYSNFKAFISRSCYIFSSHHLCCDMKHPCLRNLCCEGVDSNRYWVYFIVKSTDVPSSAQIKHFWQELAEYYCFLNFRLQQMSLCCMVDLYFIIIALSYMCSCLFNQLFQYQENKSHACYEIIQLSL